MIRVLGPRKCRQYISPTPNPDLQKLIYETQFEFCKPCQTAQDPKAVAGIINELQAKIPLGCLGDYAILCPQANLVGVTEAGTESYAGERGVGAIFLSADLPPSLNLRDMLAHEVTHSIIIQLLRGQEPAFFALTGLPKGDSSGIWTQRPNEVMTEYLCLALFEQPLDPGMVGLYGQPAPYLVEMLRDWARNLIGDQAQNPVAIVEGYDIRLTIDSPEAAVNGVGQTLAVAPVIRSGRTFLPFRFLGEALGAIVTWNDVTRRAVYEQDGRVVQVEPGNSLAWVNGVPTTLDVVPYIEQDRTMAPLRFIAEAFGFDVAWQGETRSIHITK